MAPIGPRNDARTRAARAFELRCAGRHWTEIAKACGYRTAGAAHTAVDRHIRRQPPESLAQARVYAGGGLQLVQATLFEMLAEARRRKDVMAATTVARAIGEIVDKHAKLVGMHVAVPTEVNVRVQAAEILTETRNRLQAAIDAEVLDVVEVPAIEAAG